MADQKIALVIDDDKEIVDVVKNLLKEELHYLVLPATDPETAVEFSENYLFDLLILDLHMPKLDGFQVLEVVRKKQPNAKVIVITGLFESYADQLKKIRVDKIVEKPLEFVKFKRDVLAVAGKGAVTPSPEIQVIPKAKILLVDDEKEQCEYLKEFILEDKPNLYEIEVAENGEEGIILVNEFQPDFVLFDIKMPRLRGDEMLHRIKAGDGHKPKLFIVLSTVALPDVIERMQLAGCIYITKPFRVEELIKFLRDKCIELNLVKVSNEAAAG